MFRRVRVRVVVEIGLSVALASVLAMIRVWQMPQGGTISLSMLPIIVLALLRGTGPGVAAGVIFGIVDFFIPGEGFIVSPIQYLLDYPIAFGVLGLAGIFAPAWLAAERRRAWTDGIFTAVLPGTALAVFARYGVHVLSGIIYFGANAPEGQPVWLYSALYNSFALVAGVVTFVVAAIVMPALSRALGPRDRL